MNEYCIHVASDVLTQEMDKAAIETICLTKPKIPPSNLQKKFDDHLPRERNLKQQPRDTSQNRDKTKGTLNCEFN